MKTDIKKYFKTLQNLFDEIEVTANSGKPYEFEAAIKSVIKLINEKAQSGGKLIFIGNGASAAISSHMAVDFWKNGRIRAMSFNDADLLTCISNDYGYEHVFEKPIEMFIEPNDILFAISSSGKSKNVLAGVDMARKKKAKVITFSGFDKTNELRKLGEINFYVPYSSYGYVETIHQAICHCLVDMIAENKNG